MAKTVSPEKLKKQQERKLREIAKWEKEKAKPKKSFYLVYIIFMIALIYSVDEIASQIRLLLQAEIANDLFASGNSTFIKNLVEGIAMPFTALGLFYRPFADKWGRKIFLIVNTIGMSLGMLIIFLSGNVALYVVGVCFIMFFIPHDMHVVYIMESAPSKSRAIMYSSIKLVANLSVMLVPLLKDLLMDEVSDWRKVFLVPALAGLVVCFIALLGARETDAFIDSRLEWLRKTPEELEAMEKEDKERNKQGGLIAALVFAMKHKQLRWLYITSALANIGFAATINYQAIMTFGYAQVEYKTGVFLNFDDAVNFVSMGAVTSAIFMFPVGLALAQFIMGFIADKKSRKAAAVITAFNCLLFFILFSMGSYFGWLPYLTGFFCGAAIGSYYSTNDIIIMMVGESAPTNLRSSAASAQYIVTAAGYGLSILINMVLTSNPENGNLLQAPVCFFLLVPGFVAALVTLIKKTHDTTGIDLDTVTGCEWD